MARARKFHQLLHGRRPFSRCDVEFESNAAYPVKIKLAAGSIVWHLASDLGREMVPDGCRFHARGSQYGDCSEFSPSDLSGAGLGVCLPENEQLVDSLDRAYADQYDAQPSTHCDPGCHGPRYEYSDDH